MHIMTLGRKACMTVGSNVTATSQSLSPGESSGILPEVAGFRPTSPFVEGLLYICVYIYINRVLRYRDSI